MGVQDGMVEKSGAWYSCQGERIGQGRDNARKFLQDHPDMASQIEADLRSQHGLTVPADGVVEA